MNRDLTVGRNFIHSKTYYRFHTFQDLAFRPVPEIYVTEKPSSGLVQLTTDLFTNLGKMEQIYEIKPGSLEKRLSTLLHYTMGLIRYEVGSSQRMHRPFPSPRCLYATEMYVSIPEEILGKAGVYRYNPLKHALEKRRAVAGWEQIESALGISLSGAQGVLLLGIDFWRIAYVYDDFALNLATIEAGHALGQTVLIARRLGWDLSVYDCFVDKNILSLLGMNEVTEAPLAIVVLWPHGAKKIRQIRPFQAPSLPPLPTHHPFRREMDQCGDLVQMVQASRLQSNSELPAPKEEQPGSREREKAVVLEGKEGRWWNPNWLEAVKTRSSGNDRLGMMATEPLSFADLSKVLSVLMEEKHPEWRVARNDIRLFLLANGVTGLVPGIYEVQRSPPALSPLTLGPMESLLQELSIYSAKEWNARSLPASIFIAVDYHAALDNYGNRGFQIVQMRVGQVSQHLALTAAAMGWFLRPLKSFYEVEVEQALGLLSTNYTVAYQLILGKNKTPYLSLDLGL